MGEKHSSSIVTALSLAMTAGFVAIAILILTQNVNVTVRYAESISDLAIEELSSEVSGLVTKQDALNATSFNDGKSAEGIVGESEGATQNELLARLQPALQELLEDFCDESVEKALCFGGDGVILVSSDDDLAPGDNVFDEIAALDELSLELDETDAGPWHVWVGLDGLMPRGQKIYEVRYNTDLGAYLLTCSTGEEVFAAMRTRATILILALVVVMVMLLLLLMTIVRWYRARLLRAATTDELTGLANRKSFVSSYDRYVARGGAEGSTLALIDVDRFKTINDGFGHAAGDHALAAIAAEVGQAAKDGGLAGRWGGDEFICVVPATGDEARQRIEQMIERVAARQFEEGFTTSVSVGSTQMVSGETMEHMVEQADDALYVTKESGRGFLTIYEPGVTPHQVDEQGTTRGVVHDKRELPQQAAPVAEASTTGAGARERMAGSRMALSHMAEGLLFAVGKMIPFVAGGGVLIALAFLIDGASVDLNTLSAEARANFGSITPLAAGLKEVGSAAFNFMLPIFGAFFAQSLAGDEAFMAGFAGGYLSSQGSAGFAGTIFAALVAAAVVRLMKNYMDETPPVIRRIAPVLLYPLFSLLIMYLLMRVVIGPLASGFEMTITSYLQRLQGGSRVLLCALCGALMATDMGGPINKSAYHFGLAAIASGQPDIMAAVMVGGMVPPCGIALSMLFFPDKYSQSQRDQKASVLLMGLSFITEGAIPFLLTDFFRVIPSCMLGAAAAAALSSFYECTLMAPHGGIFVFPVVNNPVLYLMSLVAGSLLCALVLGLLRKPVEEDTL